VADEEKVCDMLATIKTEDTYSDEAGEIFLSAKSQDGVVEFDNSPYATAGQKFDLTFLGVGIVVLVGILL
jgi:hypothetical protein